MKWADAPPEKRSYPIALVLVAAGAALVGLSLASRETATLHLPVPDRVVALLQACLALFGAFLIVVGLLGGSAHRARIGQRADAWVSEGRRAPMILVAILAVFTILYAGFAGHRHYIFDSATFDLGIQDQVVWNTSQGRLFQESLEVDNYLGDHFQPLLGLLALPYRIYPSPYWLLAFQTLCLTAGGIPLFRLTRRELGSSLAGLVLVFSYCLYPAIGYINRFDFHFEVIAIPLLLAAWDALTVGKLKSASLWLGIALFGKEEIGLTIAMIGLLAVLVLKRRRFGLFWFVFGTVFSLAALLVVMPIFRGGPSDTLARYAWLGQTPLQMLRRIVSDPLYVLQGIRQTGWFYMSMQLFGPVAGLNFLSPPHLLLVAPGLAYNLLSSFDAQHSAYYQYVVPIVPGVFIGTVYGTARLSRWMAQSVGQRLHGWETADYRFFCLVLLAAFGVFAFADDNPLQDRGVVPLAWEHMPNEPAIREALARIPADAAVFTTNQYGSHLSHRRHLRVYYWGPETMQGIRESDVVLFNLQDIRNTSRERYREMLLMCSQQEFGVVYENDGVVVLQRSRGDPGLIRGVLKKWLL